MKIQQALQLAAKVVRNISAKANTLPVNTDPNDASDESVPQPMMATLFSSSSRGRGPRPVKFPRDRR